MESQSAGHVAGSYAVRPGHIDFRWKGSDPVGTLAYIGEKSGRLVQPCFSKLVVSDAVVRADLNSPQCFAE